MKKYRRLFPFSFIAMLIILIVSNISFQKIINMPNDIYVSYDEIENANNNNAFGELVQVHMKNNDLTTSGDKNEKGTVVFKLFGIIPIKKVNVNILPEEEVFVGGATIGIDVKTDGVMVVSDAIIDNNASIIKNKFLKSGDIIKSINGQKIKNVEDIPLILQESEDEKVEIKILRGDKIYRREVPLIKNPENKYCLGVWVKDNCAGIGTLTFIKKQDNSFGALGHAVTNGKDEALVPITDGEIFSSTLVNIEKGTKNQPGSLQCVFIARDKKGEIDKNTKVGIYGHIDDTSGLIDSNKSIKLGGRLSVKPGEAKLISNVSGIQEEYDIEIIKTNYQAKCNDKSFIFRVKDKRLLNLTGGIVQGMSGSPIIQNGKLVGAVTHVFLSDSSKGYGVYTDWMLQQID